MMLTPDGPVLATVVVAHLVAVEMREELPVAGVGERGKESERRE